MTDDTRNADELAEEIEVAGEVTSQDGKASIPTWVPIAVIAVLAALLACACLMAMGAGGLWILDQSQPEAPVIIAPPAQEQPAEPVQEQPTQPPPEQPTQPPPEQPTQPPPEEPAEPPAGEQPPEEPPSAEQLPAEPPAAGQQPAESGSSGLPCVPLAGGLVLAPLLVIGKKGGNRRSSNK